MIKYDPKNWVTAIFHITKADTLTRLAPTMMIVALFSYGICYLEIDVYKNAQQISPIVHMLLGVVLGLFLVFRTNTAYERWWEGRRLWGQLVNDSRCLMLKIDSYVDPSLKTEKIALQSLIIDFVTHTRDHLRGKNVKANAKKEYKNYSNIPLEISGRIYDVLSELHLNGKLSDVKLSILDKEVKGFIDVLGGCERIKNTPIPFSYSVFIKKFLFAYTITLPIGLAGAFGYGTIIVSMFIFYFLVSIELLAEEIEDPFGDDDNDLPTTQIAQTIRKNLEEITDSPTESH